jgi:sugar lactone lactonase YvrE
VTVCFFGAALSCALAQNGEQQTEGVLQAIQGYSGVPTTLATLPQDSEGLTVDPQTGVLYAAGSPDPSGQCTVWSIASNGAVSQVGVVPRPTDTACAPRGLEFRNGHLYISDQGTGADGWVFEMDPETGQATIFASGVPGANGIAFDSHGNLWITDSQRGFGRVYKRNAETGVVTEVFRVPPVANGTTYGGRLGIPTASGVGRQIANVPLGTQPEVRQVANGIAVVERRLSTVYVADTARGAIWAARLDEHGDLEPSQTGCNPTLQDNTLCEDALFVAHPRLEGADGMWAEPNGTLWVAANARQGIVRVSTARRTVTEYFRNPVNSELLRSSADTAEGNTHILEFPTNPVIVPAIGSHARTLCVSSSDRAGRDNNPGTVGEIGGPGQDKGKISCF